MTIDDPNNQDGSTSPGGQDLKSQVGQDLHNVTEHARDDLDAISRRAQEDVRSLGKEAEAKVSEATDKAKSFASDQKNLAAGQINGVATAISKVADELDQSEQKTIARYARDLASGISNVGKTVEDRDVDDLMHLAQDFGRKQPLAFLGAAALAGFVASRFALASSHRAETKTAQPERFEADGANGYSAGTTSRTTGGL